MNDTNKIIYLGNIYGSHCHDGFGGAVFDIDGIAPRITTCQGGGREPHILLEEDNNTDGEYEHRKENR